MMPDLEKTFRAEAAELLTELEEALLALENDPEDANGIARVFRALHTIKGSSGMAGFTEIVRFTHDVETVLDRVRKGVIPVTREILSLTLMVKDHVQALLAAGTQPDDDLVAASNTLLDQLRPFLAPPGESAAPAAEAKAKVNGVPALYWVRFRPAAEALATGGNPLGLLEELAGLGVLVETLHTEDTPALPVLIPDRAYFWWDLLLATDKGEAAIADVFTFEDEETWRTRKVGDGSVRNSDLQEMSRLFRPGGPGGAEAVHAALSSHFTRIMTEKVRKRREAACPEEAGLGSIRVDAARLDKLVDMVGELVIIQSRLSLSVHRRRDPGLEQIAEELERLTTEMRGNALGMRMVPIGATFSSFRRMMRDLTIAMGKQVEFVTTGEETELDKTVIDRLKDPLMHILRNAVDHGIESPEARRAAGKPEQGAVTLTASNASGDVILTIRDDGKGMDPERIRQKAIERGLLAPEAEPSRRELLNLIFEPGFSTAEKVTDVSGRGVGMDVVKKGIDALRGTVEIDSTLGQGSVFTIRLPLTLAIIDGLNVIIGPESFIIPLATVEACQERVLTGEEKVIGSIERRGHLIPCISLRQLMNVPGKPPRFERIIIATVDDMEVGLAVDRVVGRQQAVIKSLSGIYKEIDWISGTTINGDGGVSLILDVMQLVRFAAARNDHEGLH